MVDQEDKPTSPLAIVWNAYQQHHRNAMLSPERRRLIERRLGEGWPVETLVDAINGNHVDPHCNGENDRTKQYHALSLILRDADHIERYAELAEDEKPRDVVGEAWKWYQGLIASGATLESALDIVEGNVPDEVAQEIRKRIEGEPA